MKANSCRCTTILAIGSFLCLMAVTGCEKVPTFQELTGQQPGQPSQTTPNATPAATPQASQPTSTPEVTKPVPIDSAKFLADFAARRPEAITDADLKTLAALDSGREQVTSMDVTRSGISDDGLLNLTKLSELSVLNLSSTGIDGHGLEALARCPNLKRLKVSGALRMSPQGWETLSKVSQLEFLDVSSTGNISDADVSKFTALTSLRELNLSETPVTDEVFKTLAEMENLEILRIEKDGLIKGHGLQAYTRSKPVLREIYASGTPLGNAGLRHIKSISSLAFLDISASNLTDQQFAELKGANNLVHLKVGANFLSNAGMQTVLGLSKLKILELEGMQTISDPGLGILSKKSGLQTLNVKKTPFTPKAIEQFRKIHKNCEVLASE
ncbi:MAG: F-box/LRR-repeat protein [Planctomycetota bacterium]|nr:MAG: F-box/LRR-repeat protein [Planctomycetota bacterium]